MRGQLRRAQLRVRAALSEWWEGYDNRSWRKRERKRARRREGQEMCIEAQRRSFVYGNVSMAHPELTREMVDGIADTPTPGDKPGATTNANGCCRNSRP